MLTNGRRIVTPDFVQGTVKRHSRRWIRLLDPAAKTALPKRPASTSGDALELKDIKAIIDLMKRNDLSVFEMEKDGFKLKLQKGAGEQTVFSSGVIPPAPIPPAAPLATPAAPAPPSSAQKDPALKDIVSPMVGTFYRAGSPESPPFAEIGKEVSEESVVCIIEAMKVMNEIKAETSGVIVEVVAENGKPVQFGQVLFRVK
jgi:acetyl-CoA carboxylase biotin carboxyl carrier protein